MVRKLTNCCDQLEGDDDLRETMELDRDKFLSCLEKLAKQLPGESQTKMGRKARFVHAVMVLAKADGSPGEQLMLTIENEEGGLPSAAEEDNEEEGKKAAEEEEEDNEAEEDPIMKAIKVLKGTTAMLDERLAKWNDEKQWNAWKGKMEEDGGREEKVSAEGKGRAEGKSGRHDEEERELRKKEEKTEGPGKEERLRKGIPPLPFQMSSKISFPSEMRKYRTMAEGAT